MFSEHRSTSFLPYDQVASRLYQLMEDFASSVTVRIMELLFFRPTFRHSSYLFRFKTYFRRFEKEKTDLEFKRDSVRERVNRAINKLEEPEDLVKQWQEKVEEVLDKAEKLDRKIQASKGCFGGGQCHYSLAKRAAEMIKTMNLFNDSKLEPFSRPTEHPGMKYISSKQFMYFESTKSAYNKILEALKGHCHLIGLYGMGGSGKTTLAKELGKSVEELGIFYKVIIVPVSHNPNIRMIQAHIIDVLGLRVEEQSEFSRAQRLSERLRKGNTLIILDDVWEKLDFEAIGIPWNHENGACSILITTRNREVCSSMHCDPSIELLLLTKEESWTWFRQCANLEDDSPLALSEVARRICDKCQGLPIAILTVGSTLRGKPLEVWEHAMSQLVKLDVGKRSTYKCLKLSYDYLANPVAKSLFFLCAMFPEDDEIEVEDLVRFGKGMRPEGWPIGIMEKTRREVYVALNNLLDSNLLLHTGKRNSVKMHDMVREVALCIAHEENQTFMVDTTIDSKLLHEEEGLQDKAGICLWNLKNSQLPEHLNCPSLKILLLHSEDICFEAPNSYPKGMTELKVLAFIRFKYRWHISMLRWGQRFNLPFPNSVEHIKNVRTLCLRGYKLGNISAVGNLKELEVLDLRGSSFTELPRGIEALKKLKLLDLFMCSIMQNNPYEVIGRCLQLEELYIWTDGDDSLENASFPKLRKYAIVRANIKVNYFESDPYNFLVKHGPSRLLWIEHFNASSLRSPSSSSSPSSSIIDLFLLAEGLYLHQLRGGYRNMVPDMDQRGMNNVIGLVLHSCSEIESLIDTNISLFQRQLVFSNLVTLRLEECQRVVSVFPAASISRTLGKLEEIRIRRCSKLKHVIAEDIELEERNIRVRGKLRPFQNLRVLDIQECESLESIIPIPFAQDLGKLEDIKLWKNPKLKYAFGTHRDYRFRPLYEIESSVDIKLPSLRRVRLKLLSDIIDICPENCHPLAPNLKDVECIACPGLGVTTVRHKFNSPRRQEDQRGTRRHHQEQVSGSGDETHHEDGEMVLLPKPGWLSLVSCLGIQQPQHLKSYIVNEFTKNASSTSTFTFAASLEDFSSMH